MGVPKVEDSFPEHADQENRREGGDDDSSPYQASKQFFLFFTHCKVYCTDKKENQIFLIYKVIRSESVAKSYMRKGFLIYEQMHKYFPTYEEAVSHM